MTPEALHDLIAAGETQPMILISRLSERREMHGGNARIRTGNARVHLFARRVYSQTEGAKLDAAIAANLKVLGYGS